MITNKKVIILTKTPKDRLDAILNYLKKVGASYVLSYTIEETTDLLHKEHYDFVFINGELALKGIENFPTILQTIYGINHIVFLLNRTTLNEYNYNKINSKFKIESPPTIDRINAVIDRIELSKHGKITSAKERFNLIRKSNPAEKTNDLVKVSAGGLYQPNEDDILIDKNPNKNQPLKIIESRPTNTEKPILEDDYEMKDEFDQLILGAEYLDNSIYEETPGLNFSGLKIICDSTFHRNIIDNEKVPRVLKDKPQLTMYNLIIHTETITGNLIFSCGQEIIVNSVLLKTIIDDMNLQLKRYNEKITQFSLLRTDTGNLDLHKWLKERAKFIIKEKKESYTFLAGFVPTNKIDTNQNIAYYRETINFPISEEENIAIPFKYFLNVKLPKSTYLLYSKLGRAEIFENLRKNKRQIKFVALDRLNSNERERTKGVKFLIELNQFLFNKDFLEVFGLAFDSLKRKIS